MLESPPKREVGKPLPAALQRSQRWLQRKRLWAGLLAGPNQARITTRPLTFKGSKLFVDVDASVPDAMPGEVMNFDECEVRAALADQSGGAIEGFTFENSSRILQSGVQEVSWKDADLSRLQGEPVRLRLEMRNVCLYAIQFV